MNIKRLLLSSLFSLSAGSVMMSLGAKSGAEVTSWAPGYPKVTRSQPPPPMAKQNAYKPTTRPITNTIYTYTIAELCQATAGGSNNLNWTSVTYIIAGNINKTIDKTENDGPQGQTVAPGSPVTDDSGGLQLGGLHPGTYDCLANASGTDAVTGAAWANGTGDTWVTCQ